MSVALAGSAKATVASTLATATAHRGLIFMASSCTRARRLTSERSPVVSPDVNRAGGAALDDKHGANARGREGYENIMLAPITGPRGCRVTLRAWPCENAGALRTRRTIFLSCAMFARPVVRRLGTCSAGRTRFPSVDVLSGFSHGQDHVRSPRPHPKGPLARQMTSHIPDTAAGAGSSLSADLRHGWSMPRSRETPESRHSHNRPVHGAWKRRGVEWFTLCNILSRRTVILPNMQWVECRYAV